MKPFMHPQFKPDSPPVSVYGSFGVKVEDQPQLPPQCPLTPVSSRTQSVFGLEDAGAGSSPVSSFAVEQPQAPMQTQTQPGSLKRQQREWESELLF